MVRNTIKKILRETDEMDWIRDIPSGIELKAGTIYYAQPPLNKKEALKFLSLITPDSIEYKEINELIRLVAYRGISYFVIDSDGNYSGWDDLMDLAYCIENDPSRGDYDVVYMRDIYKKDITGWSLPSA